jgi:hypothetical protein
MWRNPNHPRPDDEQPSAPVETGRRLATFPRGQDQELRVALAEYQGRPYVSLRVWALDSRSGQWWPVKGKGCSVRIAEAGDLAEVLSRVAREQGPTSGAPARPQPSRAPGRRDWRAENDPQPRGPAVEGGLPLGTPEREFDEFADQDEP